VTVGPLLFARYAYPPNSLGYCGPADHAALLEYGAAGVVDAGLVQLARGFEGAWPYLEIIAGANGIADPLDARVVEAYWVGNPLLDRVDMRSFGSHLLDRFRGRVGRSWEHIAESIPAGAAPHHSYHVFCVYPWLGLLRAGRTKEPLEVMDRCRIRWGQVVAATGELITVSSRPLVWDGRELGFGPPRLEPAAGATGGKGFLRDLVPGEWVSLHWDWVCDRLTAGQLEALRRYTRRDLNLANRSGSAASVA
jgi:Family of unknown function (DUF6390)